MVKDGIILGGRYDVISKLGAGGMADVYKGRDRMLNRYVAIKVLKKEYREDEEFVRKFRSEAQAAAGLLNPNIVNVYDVGEDRGLYYMVMELVEGITLKEYIQKKGKLSTKEVISISIQMCSGIEAAHKHNIIHRDIKPQNIIISKEGKVKVTDFGIAKAADSHTVSSNAMGSVHYVSPEQARGSFCDAKSDIYSAGITMYEMVTGRVPFDGETTVSVAMKHLQEQMVPPSRYAKDITPALEKIILKCTQKNPDRRYANVGLLIQDLKRALVDPDGNFVVLPGVAPSGDTVMISRSSMDDTEEYDDDYDEYDDDYDDDGDEYDDDYDDDEDGEENPEDEKEARKKKIMRAVIIVVAVVLVVALIFIIGRAAGVFSSDGTRTEQNEADIEVPNLVGQTQAVAERMCEQKNLVMEVTGERPSSEYEAGVVIEQTPEEGEMAARKDVIQVVISSGPEEITVPSVSNMDEDAAKEALIEAGFEDADITVTGQNSSDVESGMAIGTDPAEGTTVESGSKITLYISNGAEQVSVPNLVGMTVSEAQNELANRGLSDGGVSGQEYSSRYAEGQIISQSPSSGRVDAGTSVSYVVSLGPEPAPQVQVPSLRGQTLSEARNRLENVGLRVGNTTYEASDQEYGTVIRVEPSEGSSVEEGSSVNLVLSDASLAGGGGSGTETQE